MGLRTVGDAQAPHHWRGQSVTGKMPWCRMRASRSRDLIRTAHARRLSDDAYWSQALLERARAHSRERCRPRRAFLRSISTSTSGNRAGWNRPRTSGARSSAACSPATSGSSMVTTTPHSTCGSRGADTVVVLDTPWWVCARRAFVRGIRRRPVGFQLPKGCDESALRRLREEWFLAWRIWRVRRSERELELRILSRDRNLVTVYVLRSRRAARDFVSASVPVIG